MRDIFIAHPSLQHAHQLAWALFERDLLQTFWSGVPVLGDGEAPPFWIPAKYKRRMKSVSIPAEQRRHPAFFQGLLRLGSVVRNSDSRSDFNHRIFHLFDWWVSRQIIRMKPRVVIGYENSSFHTFRAAKSIGAKCILDAPSLHHMTAADLMNVGATPYTAEINRRKDEEVAMADLILTCSPMAAESYIAAGVPSVKVRSMLLGATLPEGVVAWSPHSKPIRFIFAGGLRYLKSIDLILSVFKRLHAEGRDYQLIFVGGEAESGWIRLIDETPGTQYFSGVPQAELFQMFAGADCLLLPSRFDSFGMVVAEAMACGTPAIVSTQTGAKAMIEQFPGSGWVVACDEESLYQCVRERIQNRDELFAARAHASDAARHFTWRAYRARVGKFIENWVNG